MSAKIMLIFSAAIISLSSAYYHSNSQKRMENMFKDSEEPIEYDTTELPYVPIACVTSQKVPGVCISQNFCDENGGVITDGKGLSRHRSTDPCPASDNVCCTLPGTNTSPTPARIVTPDPVDTTDEEVEETTPETVLPIDPKGCGIRQISGAGERVGGGTQALLGEFPWTVAIFKVKGNVEEYCCGGSLINPFVVLTSAIKFMRPGKWRARAGEYDILGDYEVEPHQSRDITEIVTHDDFNSGSFAYNIALLFVKIPFQVTPTVNFACLPRADSSISAGTRCIATGWGDGVIANTNKKARVIKMVEVPIVDKRACQAKLRKANKSRQVIGESSLCAGGQEGRDVCRGDGGSPLVCQIEEDKYVQAGIVSTGARTCGTDGVPSMYTDVGNLRSWVDEVVSARGHSTSSYTY